MYYHKTGLALHGKLMRSKYEYAKLQGVEICFINSVSGKVCTALKNGLYFHLK